MAASSGVIPSWGSPTLENIDFENAQTGVRLVGKGRQYVRFYKKKFAQVYATDVQINPITGSTKVLATATRDVEKEFVEIITPGDKNSYDDVAEEYHKREFWKQYKAFRNNEGVPQGKDLDHCTYVPTATATELKYRGCYTEEQLADASDLLVGMVANGWDLREFAKAMVKADRENKTVGEVGHLKGELVKAQSTITQLMEEQDKLRTMMQELNARTAPEEGNKKTGHRKIITDEVN